MIESAYLYHCLLNAFPQIHACGTITQHECSECDAMRAQLVGKGWCDLSPEFVRANSDALPLLSHEAYIAYLPAWLHEALCEPGGEVAGMLLVNLRTEPRSSGFNVDQAAVVIAVAEFISEKNGWGVNDPVNVESVSAIRKAWSAEVVLGPNSALLKTFKSLT